uniref:Uncharacterized protein n=1 Tax=Panagrolaimus davidi TaxID=227884 RepID=A0A914QHL8_9BILA
MQLLRGIENYEHPLLTCAVFVRLQRRFAVENYMQYLYDVPKRLHGIKAASGAGHPPIGASQWLHVFITGQEGYAMFMKNERTFEGEKKNRHGPQIKIDPRQSCDPGIFLFLYLSHFPQLPHPVLALDCGIIANADGLADTSDLWILYRGPENFDFSGTIEQYGIVPQHSQRFHVNQLRQLLMQVQLFQDVGETAKADSITSASRLMFVHEIENFFH